MTKLKSEKSGFENTGNGDLDGLIVITMDACFKTVCKSYITKYLTMDTIDINMCYIPAFTSLHQRKSRDDTL